MGNTGATFPMLLCICFVINNGKSTRICGGINSPEFTERLQDQTVKAGRTADFACAVRHFKTTIDEFTWQVRPDINRKEITGPSVNADVSISRITLYDIGTISLHISCTVEYPSRTDSSLPQTCQISSSATLLVEYFPGKDALTCSHFGPQEVHIGDILSVGCEVPRCDPAVDLTWGLRDQKSGFLPLPSITDIGLMRVLRQDLMIDASHHLTSVICLVTSEFAFPSEKLECMIGPLKVLRPPSVHIYPRQINVSKGDSFHLSCLSSGYPQATDFLWSCSPEGILVGCDSTFQNITSSVSRDSNNGTTVVNVSCTATNSEGSHTSNTIVTAQSDAVAGELTSDDDAEHYYVVKLSIIRKDNPCCLSLSCSLVPDISSGMVEFQWIINGRSVGHEDLAIRQESFSTASFTFPNNFDINGNKVVTCRINVNGTTFESSQNVSLHSLTTTSETSTIMTYSFHTKVPSDIFHTKQDTKNIPTGESNTTHGAYPAISVINHGKSQERDNSQETTFQISTWKLASIIIGAIFLFIIITVCAVALVSVFMYRYFTKTSSILPLNSIQASEDIRSHMANNSGHAESSISDPIYELANTVAVPKPTLLISTSTDRLDNFPSQDIPPRSLMSSYDDYGSCSSDCTSEDNNSREYEEYSSEDSVNVIMYRNQSVIEMMHKEKQSILPSKQCREDIMDQCADIPIPPLPAAQRQ